MNQQINEPSNLQTEELTDRRIDGLTLRLTDGSTNKKSTNCGLWLFVTNFWLWSLDVIHG